MNIYLLRHPKIDLEAGICYGQSDILLLENWQESIKEVFDCLPNLPGLIVYSPLTRCEQVALFLHSHTQIPILAEASFMEMNFGEWEKMAWNDIEAAPLEVWMNDFVNQRPPAGENLADLYSRSIFGLQHLTSQYKHLDSILIISHAGVIRCLLAWAMGLQMGNIFRLEIQTGKASGFWFDDRDEYRKVIFMNK